MNLVLELTRLKLSLLEASLRRIAERLRQEAIESLERHVGEAVERKVQKSIMSRWD